MILLNSNNIYLFVYFIIQKIEMFLIRKLECSEKKNKQKKSIMASTRNEQCELPYGTWRENQARQQNMDLDYCCEVDGVDGYSYYSDNSEESYDWSDPRNCVTPPATKPAPEAPHKRQSPSFDLNDPLRYCLETGLIDEDEYEKWKIVKQPKPTGRNSSTIDFGAGYNSESGTDDEDFNYLPEVLYGTEYVTEFPCRRIQPGGAFVIDPWFPNPDPTPKKLYTDFASNLSIMMRQFVVFEDNTTSRLNYAFKLKLMWEQFISNSKKLGHQSLQHFWEFKSFDVYEALQDLTETHAKCFTSSAQKLIPNTPEFHTTPLETLEHTFETIGRMCRCMAEDFNTQPIVTYVEEFIRALYIEMRYMELVEANVETLIHASYDKDMNNTPKKEKKE